MNGNVFGDESGDESVYVVVLGALTGGISGLWGVIWWSYRGWIEGRTGVQSVVGCPNW